jgi:hypothetical protein
MENSGASRRENADAYLFGCLKMESEVIAPVVIPERAKRESGIHNPCVRCGLRRLTPHFKLTQGVWIPGLRQGGASRNDEHYRKLALILSSAVEPGHSAFSPSWLSGVSTVLRWVCRSSESGST